MEFTATSSGLKNADAAIAARNCRLLGVQVLTDGINAATLILYDNASAASGTALAKIAVPGANLYIDMVLPESGVEARNGIYADVSGVGATYIVHYALL